MASRSIGDLERRYWRRKKAFVAWAVEGCLEWLRDGIQHPPCVDAATDAYRLESDPLLVFVEDQCIREPQCSVGAIRIVSKLFKPGTT